MNGIDRYPTEFDEVHCITFGTPPVTTLSVQAPVNSVFLSIINEGDPVCLAQTEYIKKLIDVFALSHREVTEKHAGYLDLPEPVYQYNGSCVFLRDKDPDDAETEGYEACFVQHSEMKGLLFGDLNAHKMDEYVSRLQTILHDQRMRHSGSTSYE